MVSSTNMISWKIVLVVAVLAACCAECNAQGRWWERLFESYSDSDSDSDGEMLARRGGSSITRKRTDGGRLEKMTWSGKIKMLTKKIYQGMH